MPEGIASDGEKIKRYRTGRVWTQEQLAERAELSKRAVQQAEAGKPVSFDTLHRIAQALGVAAEELRCPATQPISRAEQEAEKGPHAAAGLETVERSVSPHETAETKATPATTQARRVWPMTRVVALVIGISAILLGGLLAVWRGAGDSDAPPPNERNPAETTAHRDPHDRGLAYLEAGKWDLTIAEMTEAIRRDPKDAVAHHLKGIALNRKGEFEKALASLDEAIRLNPKDAEAYINRGWARLETGRSAEALADYTEAIRLQPSQLVLARAYHGRGDVYARKGESDPSFNKLALADYTEAIHLDPRSAWSYFNRAAVYERMGNTKQAEEDRKEARRLDLSVGK